MMLVYSFVETRAFGDSRYLKKDVCIESLIDLNCLKFDLAFVCTRQGVTCSSVLVITFLTHDLRVGFTMKVYPGHGISEF